jgi:hypothetical protein
MVFFKEIKISWEGYVGIHNTNHGSLTEGESSVRVNSLYQLV